MKFLIVCRSIEKEQASNYSCSGVMSRSRRPLTFYGVNQIGGGGERVGVCGGWGVGGGGEEKKN